MKSLGALLARYITTALAFAGILFVFFTVDQIRHIFPAADSSIIFHTYTWGVVTCYLVVLTWLLLGWGQTRINTIMSRHANWALAVLFGLTGVAFLVLTAMIPDGLRDGYLLDGAVLASTAVLFLLWGGWIAATVLRFCQSRWNFLPPPAIDVLLRTLLAVSALTIVSEVVWCFALAADSASPRAYTVGALCQIALVILCFTAFFDTWASAHGRPAWVVGGVSLAALTIWGLHSPSIGQRMVWEVPQDTNKYHAGLVDRPIDTGVTAVTADSHPDTWLGQLLLRMSPPGEATRDDPVIFVAASGGGSRAALFTALVYDDLRSDSIDLDDPETPDDEGEYAPDQHIAVISSVSGGTLASACYVSPDYNDLLLKSDGQRDQPKHSHALDVVRLMQSEADALSRSRRFLEIHPPAVVNAVRADCEDHAKSRTLWRFQQRAYIDDMCADFMAPLLRGALHPELERGISVANFWKQQLALSATNLSRRSPERLTALAGRHPLLLCNASDVSGGGAIVIGFPEVDAGLLAPSAASPGHVGGVPVRGLLDVEPGHAVELGLSECARLSANFPWGFQVPSLDLKSSKGNGGGDASAELHLIDGGVFDNTGITTIRGLFSRLEELASTEGTLMQVQARLVLNELKRRGVILLEIDSGAKPEPPGFVAQMFSGVLEPVTALNNAAYRTAGYLRERNTAALKSALQSGQAAELQDRLRVLVRGTQGPVQEDLQLQLAGSIDFFYHVVIVCNEEDNVMTAWALGPDDKARIFVRYLVAREQLRRKLRDVVVTHRYVTSRLDNLETIVQTMESSMESGQPPSYSEEVKPAVVFLSGLVKARDALQIDTEIEQRRSALYSNRAPDDQLIRVGAAYREFSESRQNLVKLPLSNAMLQSLPANLQAKVDEPSLPADASPSEIATLVESQAQYKMLMEGVDIGLKDLDRRLEVIKGFREDVTTGGKAASPP